MSRKGKEAIKLPKGTVVDILNGKVTVKGPKGTLEKHVPDQLEVTVSDGTVVVTIKEECEGIGAFHGLFRCLVNNMIMGTSQGFEKRLEMIGVGYRAAVKGKMLDVQVGYSHPTQLEIPAGIEVQVEKNTQIIIKGIDKQAVGQFAADIRAKRPPEPYQGKGIRYVGEYVRRKAGKSSSK